MDLQVVACNNHITAQRTLVDEECTKGTHATADARQRSNWLHAAVLTLTLTLTHTPHACEVAHGTLTTLYSSSETHVRLQRTSCQPNALLTVTRGSRSSQHSLISAIPLPRLARSRLSQLCNVRALKYLGLRHSPCTCFLMVAAKLSEPAHARKELAEGLDGRLRLRDNLHHLVLRSRLHERLDAHLGHLGKGEARHRTGQLLIATCARVPRSDFMHAFAPPPPPRPSTAARRHGLHAQCSPGTTSF